MAATGLGSSAAGQGHSSPSSTSQTTQPAAPPPPSSSSSPADAAAPVEIQMSDLEPRTGTGLVTDVSINPVAPSPSSPSHVPISHSTATTNMADTTKPTPATGASISSPNSSAEGSAPAAITRLDSVAIGPSTDIPPTPITTTTEAGPVLVITLLLTSGARHPYKIDEKYLTKRNVNIKDPYAISVYTLKELILREWRDEWEPQPSSPSSIRLIYFGRLLDDKTPLKECKFNAESANVVHMTVRPQDIVDEEDASKSKTLARDRENSEREAGCRCVIL